MAGDMSSVRRREYAFGGHDLESSGIFSVAPKTAYDLPLRESIYLGRTNMSPKEVEGLLNSLAPEWKGNSYDFLERNCNSFCECFSERLLHEKNVPRYVNRAARFGAALRCLLPQTWFGAAGPSSPPQNPAPGLSSAVPPQSFAGVARRLTEE